MLATVYAVFTAGHHAPVGELDARLDLADEAIRLARVLVELMPDEAECVGLLALTLATNARLPARTDPEGEIVLLADQDRALWDAAAIAEAATLVDSVLRRGRPGAYQIAGRHRLPARRGPLLRRHRLAADRRAVRLLEVRWPTPVVRVNRAVAVAEVAGRSRRSRLARRPRWHANGAMAPVLVDSCRLSAPPRSDRGGRRLIPASTRMPMQRQRPPVPERRLAETGGSLSKSECLRPVRVLPARPSACSDHVVSGNTPMDEYIAHLPLQSERSCRVSRGTHLGAKHSTGGRSYEPF